MVTGTKVVLISHITLGTAAARRGLSREKGRQAMVDAAIVQAVGLCAALASTASFTPQAWKIIWTRDVQGLSAGMYMLTVSAFALWLGYGVLKGDWALILPNGLCLILSMFILLMILVSRQTRTRVAETVEKGLTKGLNLPHGDGR